jgi:hypothetical protein
VLARAAFRLVDADAVGFQRLRRILVAPLALAARAIQIRRLRAQLAAARREPAQLVARAIEILLLGDDAHLVGAHRRAQLLERAPDLHDLLLGGHVPRQRGLVVGVEPRDHLLELADLALLLQHTHRRLARAAADHAMRIDDLAIERDDGLVGAGLAPQRDRLVQVLDHQHVAEQVVGHRVVLPVVADQVQHRPANAVAGRPGQLFGKRAHEDRAPAAVVDHRRRAETESAAAHLS